MALADVHTHDASGKLEGGGQDPGNLKFWIAQSLDRQEQRRHLTTTLGPIT